MTTGVTSASSCHTHALLPMILQLFLFSTLPSESEKSIAYTISRRVFKGQMEIFLFLVRRKAAATSCEYNPLVSLTLQYNTSSIIYYSAREREQERENHCARVVRISLLSHWVNDMTDAKSIYSSRTCNRLLHP